MLVVIFSAIEESHKGVKTSLCRSMPPITETKVPSENRHI